MKTQFPGLHIASFIALFATIAGIALGAPTGITLTFAAVSAGSIALTIRLWLRYVRNLLADTDKLLDKKEDVKTWSFNNLTRLKKNQDEAAKKFHTSANLISNLTQPEKIVVTNEDDFKDPIGKALLTIKTEMQRIKEADERRTWITQGIAGFGEVLRNKLEVKEYGYQIISYIIKYLGANQGRFFIEYQNAEKERYLELIASYAYGKRKFQDDIILEGQGVLGQNMLEKDFIFMTAVPDSYVKITSGLGEATPRNIIVAPLVFNEIYCGAIELASFHVLQDHHLEFLRRVCEDIASEIMAIKTMGTTQGLLDEARNLTLELQSREEEMKLKQTELTGIINAIDSTLATAEFDSMGRLITHNVILEKFTGYSDIALSGKDYSLIIGSRDKRTWERIWAGEVRSGDFKTKNANGSELWVSVTFTPITDEDNYSIKLLCLIQDITQKKQKEIDFARLSIVANNTDNSVIITNKKGQIEYVNPGFTKMTGYLPNEVIGRKPGSFLQGDMTEKKTVQKLSQHIAEGISINEEILNYTKAGEKYWVSLAINPVTDDQGVIVQYISIQTDITHTKIKSLDFNQKLEALSRSNAIIEMDYNGIVLDINENYLKMFNYQREDVIGKNYSIFTHKENAFEKLKSTIRQHGMQSGVYSRYDKNGNECQVKLMDYPVLDMNGELEKIIEFGVDVSNEKRLEQEAERRQAELNSYLAGIDNTIATAAFNLKGNLIDANEIFLKVMGYTSDDFGKNNFDFMMGDDQALTMMWENLRLGKFFSGEYKMRNKVGKELWLTGTFNPIFVSGNEPEKIMMFAQFTTQEKEKVNDLTGMVNALKSTLPVMEFSQHFACKTANEKALKIFGLSRIELRSKKLEDFIAPHYHHLWDQYKHEVLRTDIAHVVIPFVIGGQTTNYEVSMSVIKNLEGEIGKVIVLLVKEVHESVSVMKAV